MDSCGDDNFRDPAGLVETRRCNYADENGSVDRSEFSDRQLQFSSLLVLDVSLSGCFIRITRSLEQLTNALTELKQLQCLKLEVLHDLHASAFERHAVLAETEVGLALAELLKNASSRIKALRRIGAFPVYAEIFAFSFCPFLRDVNLSFQTPLVAYHEQLAVVSSFAFLSENARRKSSHVVVQCIVEGLNPITREAIFSLQHSHFRVLTVLSDSDVLCTNETQPRFQCLHDFRY